MIPRGSLDLTWTDWLAAAVSCILPGKREFLETQITRAWHALTHQGATSEQQVVVTLSVRSAWDLFLESLALPAGSEVLLSDISIPSMVSILRKHQLVPIPLPVDPATLTTKPADVAAAITPRTVAVLFAPLFGSRADLRPISEIAHAAGLLVIEDGAQRFGAVNGLPDAVQTTADVLFLSFGLIKTATALGGGLLITSDAQLAGRLRQRQQQLPVQSRGDYGLRVGKAWLLKVLSNRFLFGCFVRCCRTLRRDHDELISQNMRSFVGERLFPRLRRQPSISLLRVLCRRLKNFRPEHLHWRQNLEQCISAQFRFVERPGSQSQNHAHWGCPVRSKNPLGLIKFLREQGFDATQRASSLVQVSTLVKSDISNWLHDIVYLPLHPTMTKTEAVRLGQLVEQFETGMLAIEATGEFTTLRV